MRDAAISCYVYHANRQGSCNALVWIGPCTRGVRPPGMSAGPRGRRRDSRGTSRHAQDGAQLPDQLPGTTLGSSRFPEATGVQPTDASALEHVAQHPDKDFQQAGGSIAPVQRAAEGKQPQGPAGGSHPPAERVTGSWQAGAGQQTAARQVPAQAQPETQQPLASQQRPHAAHTGTATAPTQAIASVLEPPVYSPLGPPMPGKPCTALSGI